jgi:hypothetical protein
MVTVATPATRIVPQITADVLAAFQAAHPTVDATRLAKAVRIVQAGAVERLPAGLWLVISETSPDGCYRVTHGQCNCPDAARRDARGCKHAIGVALFIAAERAEAEQGLDVDAPIGYELTALAFELLGEACDLPAQCSRCGQEAAIPSHRDHLGATCISRELFGDDDAA